MKIVEINDKLAGKTINVVVETEKSHSIQNIFVLRVKTTPKASILNVKTGENTSIELPRRTMERLSIDDYYEDAFKSYRIIYKVL